MRTNISRQKRLLITTVVMATLITLMLLLGALDVASPAYAAITDSPYYANGASLDFVIDTETYSVSYDCVLAFPTEGAASQDGGKWVYGSFYSEDNCLQSFSPYTSDGAHGFAITNAINASSVWYVDMQIDPNSLLAKAIKDNLIKVTLQPYFIWGLVTPDGGGETGKASLTYYTGTEDELHAPISESSAPVTINYAGSNGDNNERRNFAGYTLPNVYGTECDAFVRLKFWDYTLGGSAWNTAIREMGVTITCEFNGDLSSVTSSVEIIDYTGLRSPEASDDLVKAGDTVVIHSEILSGVSTLDLNTKNAGESPDFVNGDFYRRLFMHNTSGTLLRYKFSETEFTQIYSYEDAEGHNVDISGDYSGRVAAFTVLRTTSAHLQITTRLYNADNETGFMPKIDDLYADNTAAAQPYLDASDAFYKKYVGTRGTAYYTNEVSYVKEDVDVEGNGVLVNTVVAVDLGQGASIPRFTSDALAIGGAKPSEGFHGSSQIMYYRVTVLNKAPSVNGEKSEGFMPSEASGVYCNVIVGDTGAVSVYYDKLILPLAWEEEVDGVNKMVYHKTGMYSIEFVTVDYAGNRSFCPQKFYVKVDTSDYEFTYQNYINTDGNTSVDSYVTISFAKLDDNNNLSSRFSTPIFKRGDRILVYVKFSSDGFSRYILTQFALPGGNNKINTTNNEYDSSRQTAITQSSSMAYTFEVNSLFEDPRLRSFTLTYKFRAILSVSNKTQVYNGTGRSLSVVLKDSSGNSVTGNVSITYATDVNGPYTSTLPIDAGTYYYKCELLNHLTYYGYTSSVMEADISGNPSVFKILPVDPYISDIRISQINYGDSLAIVDFNPNLVTPVFNQSVQAAGSDGIYYSDRSSDSKGMYRIRDEYRDLGCIYGYYMISDIDDGTYNNPAAGNLSLTIKFVPIVMTYDEGSGTYVPKLQRGADNNDHFIEDGNYASIKINNVVITINHSTSVAYDIEGLTDDAVSYEYDGTSKAPRYTVTSTLAAESGTRITDYTRLNFEEKLSESEYGASTTEAPVNAGVYRATVTILTSRCNYTGEKVFTLVIEKRKLNVEGYESPIEFRYQEEQPLTPTASYGEVGDKVYYNGLNYNFTYYYHDGGIDNSTSAIEANLVDPSEIFGGTGMPENVGTYVVKIEINERNYANAANKYARFSIKPADVTYANLTLTAPTLSYNSNTREAHLNYLQPLSYVKFGTNANTGVKFVFHAMDPVTGRKYTEIRSVAGYFILSYRLFRSSGHAEETMEEFVEEVSVYDDYTVGRHIAYIYFIPTGEFARNFLPVYRETEITIGRAVLLLDDVTIQNIIYGTRVSSIDDLTLSKNVKVLINEIDRGGDIEVEYFVLNTCADPKYKIYLADNKITVEFCDDNVVATILREETPDLSKHFKAKISADIISSFDGLSVSLGNFVGLLDSMQNITEDSDAYDEYLSFVTAAKALYDDSVLPIANNVNVDPDKGAVINLAGDYSLNGKYGYYFSAVSDPLLRAAESYQSTVAANKVRVTYLDYSGLGAVLKDAGATTGLARRTDTMYGDGIYYFDAVGDYYAYVKDDYILTGAWDVFEITDADDTNYLSLLRYANRALTFSDNPVTNNIQYALLAGAVIGINDEFVIFGEDSYYYFPVNEPKIADLATYYELRGGKYVLTTDETVASGKPYYRRNTYNEYLKVLSTLFGYADVNTFTSYATALAAAYHSNSVGASTDDLAHRLLYDGAIYTDNGSFVLPYVFTGNKVEGTVTAFVIVDADGGMGIWLSDVHKAFLMANYDNVLALGAEENADISIYGRYDLYDSYYYYELSDSKYVFTSDTAKATGKTYYRRNTFDELAQVVAGLFGCDDVTDFGDALFDIFITYFNNYEGADALTIARRLRYDGAIYVDDYLFILPFVFKNDKLSAPVLSYLVFDINNLEVYMYLSDVDLAFRTVNYNNVLNLGANAATLSVYGRCELFEVQQSYSYTLMTVIDGLYNAGEHYIDIRVTPTDTTSFAPITVTKILTVNKRNLTVTYSSDMSGTYATGFDNLGESFEDLMELFTLTDNLDEWMINTTSPNYEAYLSFFTYAKQLFDNSRSDMVRDIEYELGQGAIFGLNNRFAIKGSGASAVLYYPVSDPDPSSLSSYYEMIDDNLVATEDTEIVVGKRYYELRENNYDEVLSALAVLLGTDVVTMLSDFNTLAAEFAANGRGANVSNITNRLLYDDAFYTSNGAFVIPLVLLNDWLTTPVLTYVIWLDSGLMSIYVNDVWMLFRTAIDNNDSVWLPWEDNFYVTDLRRAELFGEYAFTYGGVSDPEFAFSLPVTVGGETKYYDHNGNEVTDLKVGAYKAIFNIVNDNYEGVAYYDVVVDKDVLIVTPPSIYNQSSAVAYNELMDNVTFYNGVATARNTGANVSGRFYFDYPYGTRFTETGVLKPYKLIFIPDDSANYKRYDADDLVLNLRVAKANVSSGISMEVESGFVYGDLSVDDLTADDLSGIVRYTTSIRKDDQGQYNYDNDPAYDYLAADVSFDGLPASGLLNAGDYLVTLTINDDNYSGTASYVLHVSKKAAKIALYPDANGETNEKIFRNRNQNVSYVLLTDDLNEDVITTETVTQTFFLNGIKQQTMPSGIGKYSAILTLVSNNYYAEVFNTDFTIKVDPAQIRVINLDQTYNMPRAVIVSLGLNDAVYSLSYVNKTTREEFFSLPTNAGEYEVKLNFASESNQGYSESITYTENSVTRYLVINKYNATITVPDVITVTYTGNSYDPRPTTEPYGLTIVKEYKAQGDSEYSDVEVKKANTGDGYHFIRFTITDDNFACVKEVRYRINPATLTIVADPTFGEYTYNTDVPPALISAGMVNFGAIADIEGDYSFIMDDIKTLAVGTHTVRYVFTPTDGGDVNTDFVPAEGQITLSIVKKAISAENITIGAVSTNSAYYDGTAHTVDATVVDGLVYDPIVSNSDFRVVVYYNGNMNAPRDPGSYTIRAVVSSKNYSGEKTWEDTFIIHKGIPVISSAPAFIEDSYAVNTVLTTNDLTVGSGRAIIEGTDTVISGDFTVVDALLNKANYNQVLIEFTPGDTDRFEKVSCYVSVFAIGAAPLNGVNEGENWDDKVITVSPYGTVTVVAWASGTVYYGAKLSAFTLKFVGDNEAVEYLSDFGSLSFVEPNAVPEAGTTLAKIKFTPYDAYASEYTITSGYVSVTVAKSDLTDYSVELKGYFGKTIGEIEFVAKDALGDLIELNGAATYYDSNDDLIPASTVIDLSLIGTTAEIKYVFVDDNYNDLIGFATLSYVYELEEDNIEVGRLTKSYDGRNVSVSDLDISVTNVSVSASADDISILVYDAFGNRSDGVEVGDYKVIVTVSNSVLYGVKVVDFTVTKRDVSTDMTLDIYSTVYASVAAPKAMVDGEYVGERYSVSIRYKASGASDASYNVNLPVNAGDYNVKVTVDGPNYAGVKVFDFRVEKLAVRLVADTVYSYRYGNASIPTVGFRYADSADTLVLSYDLYYYSANYSMSKTLPSNAGEYVARVVLNANNYSIMGNSYAEFRYVIERMSTTITALPLPVTVTDNTGSYNVKYGQALRSLSLMGGVASRLDVPVDGYFTVTEPDLILNAGNASVQVTFIPYDNNYAESYEYVSIVVGKADATVVFDRLQTSYTGSSCANALMYTVNPSNVIISVTFRNAAGEVTANPVNAGSYTLQIVCNDNNYSIISATDREGNNPIFVIAKAAVRSIVDPKANDITVGESLLKSSLNSGADYGLVYYVGFDDPVAGNFTYVESSLTFTTAGTYAVDYKFAPVDSANFALGRGTTTIKINKATATISVSNFTYTYAEGFRYPTFTTYPANLTVKHNITFREYDPTAPDYLFNIDDYVDVGTYEFRAWVEDDNYLPNETTFRIVINKKVLDLDFVDGEGNEVKQYVTTYGITNDVKFRLYQAGTAGKSGYLQKDEVVNGRNIADLYEIRFRSAQSGDSYDDRRAPSNIGSYYVTVTLINNNYTATNSIMYKVNRGIIQGVYFDDNSRENQVYGKVTDPIITTVPAGIKYYIVYKGTDGNRLPTDAGSYNMTVYFDDPNYETKQVDAQFRIAKKPVTITKITVEDKTYDGITALKITGSLEGVLPGDEVSLTMTAETADGSAKVGAHYVKITSYVLSGLRAQNYIVSEPQYLQQVNITGNKVTASDTSSFITSTAGFDEGTTVEFRTVATKKNASTFFEKVTGRSSTVIGFTVKENGADTLIKDAFKVYLAIPEEYLNSDFEVKGVGALEGKNVVFTREGNYITFYASSSGQVQFKKSEFRYEALVLGVAVAMSIIGIGLLMVLFPLQSRRKFSDNSLEKAYAKRTRGGY